MVAPRFFIQVSALIVAAFAAGVAQAGPPATLQVFLRDTIEFKDSDFAALEGGEVVTRLLPATDSGEIAAFGIVRIGASVDAVERLAIDVKRYRQMDGLVEMGLFSEPAATRDLNGLTIAEDDIDALKKCKPGSCDVKLTETALDRIAHVDWSTKDAREQAIRLCKEMMVELVTAYRTGGTDAMGTVVDKRDPKSRSAEFHRLLANSPYLFQYLPRFHDYLEAYPARAFPGVTNVLYWTTDTFAPKPVISLQCSSIARLDGGVVIATKLLAATHFFNAGLDVCAGVPGTDVGSVYLVDVYRVRLDPPTGMLAGAAMKRVEKGIEEGVRRSLSGMQNKLN